MRNIIYYDENLKPEYENFGDMCINLRSAVNLYIEPGKYAIIQTGIKTNFFSKVYINDDLCFKDGIILMNSVLITEASSRKEISLVVLNISNETKAINKYEKIAKMETFFHKSYNPEYYNGEQEFTVEPIVISKKELKLVTKEEWDKYGEGEDSIKNKISLIRGYEL